MSALRVACALGVVEVDLDSGEWDIADEDAPEIETEPIGLPLVQATARCGSRIVAVVTARPPLMISDDAGTTWRAAGRGLPACVDVAFVDAHPDSVVLATSERLYVSTDGGRFWTATEIELPEITSVASVADGSPAV